MTTQAMRRERRAQRAEAERTERIQLAMSALLLVFLFLAFCFSGTSDFIDDQRELAYWAGRGVTIQRW